MTQRYLAAAFVSAFALAAPALAASTDIEGNWDAQQPSAGGLAELDITFDGRTYQVRAAAVCAPRVCEFGEASVAFVVDGEVARLRKLVLGRTLADDREVLSGLSGGERVALDPPDTLIDGARVRLQPDATTAAATQD